MEKRENDHLDESAVQLQCGLILGCATDFLCNWELCNCLHPIFPVSADVTERETEKPNT